MRTVLNVLRISLSGAICMSLITACGDGRGSSGFKSFKYSSEEIAKNQARLKAEQDAKNPKSTTPGPDRRTDDTESPADGLNGGGQGSGDSKSDGKGDTKGASSGGNNENAGGAKGASAPAGGAAVESGLFKNTDKASSQIFAEKKTPLEQQKTADIKDINLTIERETSGNKKNEEASKLVKGYTVTVKGTAEARTVSIEALLVIEGQLTSMFVANEPVRAVKDGEQVLNVNPDLKKACTEETVFNKDNLYVGIKCKDESCTTIEALLDIKDGSKRVNAVLTMQEVSGQFVAGVSNVEAVPFTKALELNNACKLPAELTKQAETKPPETKQPEVKTAEAKKEQEKAQLKDAGISTGKHKADECPKIDGEWEYQQKAENDETKASTVLFMFVRSDKNELGMITADDDDLVFAVNGQIAVDKNETSYIGYCERGELTMEITPKNSGMGKLHFAMNADGNSGKMTRTDSAGKVEVFDFKREEENRQDSRVAGGDTQPQGEKSRGGLDVPNTSQDKGSFGDRFDNGMDDIKATTPKQTLGANALDEDGRIISKDCPDTGFFDDVHGPVACTKTAKNGRKSNH